MTRICTSLWMVILIVTLWQREVVSYGNGAPSTESVCSKMFPNHGVSSQIDAAPVSINVPRSYRPRGTYASKNIHFIYLCYHFTWFSPKPFAGIYYRCLWEQLFDL